MGPRAGMLGSELNIAEEHCSLLLDSHFCILACSAEFSKLSGYASDEVLGRDLEEVLHEVGESCRSAGTDTEALQSAIRTQQGFTMTMLCYTKGSLSQIHKINAHPTKPKAATQPPHFAV